MNDAAPQTEVATAPAPSGAAFAFIFITILLDMVALGIIIPVLPSLVLGFVGGDTPRSAEVLGLFGTAWALMQFLFSPTLGALSDRFGRRPVILISNAGLGLDYILMAVAPSLAWLFVGRVISGITSASVGTAFAYVTDVTPPELAQEIEWRRTGVYPLNEGEKAAIEAARRSGVAAESKIEAFWKRQGIVWSRSHEGHLSRTCAH
jgi:MFS family permease